MYLQIAIKELYCEQFRDNPLNPFDRKMELYQTWQLMAAQELGGANTTRWARQGFSLGGAPKKGLSIGKGENRKPYDPKITFTLPSDLQEGECVVYQLFMHHFESDNSSEKVRGVFTDDTLKFLVKAWEEAEKDEKKAKKALLDYIDKNPELIKNGIQNFIVATGLGNAAGVTAVFDLLPILKLVIDILKNNADDYINSNELTFEFKKEGGVFKWRFNSPDADINPWNTGEGVQLIESRVENGKGKIKFDATFQCRVLD